MQILEKGQNTKTAHTRPNHFYCTLMVQVLVYWYMLVQNICIADLHLSVECI